jgi:hypothetical protein
MKTNRTFWLSLVIAMGTASVALAKPLANDNAPADGAYVVPLPKASTLADNVIVGTPGSPQPAPAPVVVQPNQPVAAVPVATDPEPRKEVVHVDADTHHNYMGTIAVNALMGGVAGVLVGGAIYYLGNQTHAANIGYWAAGGVLVGTGVGLLQVAVEDGRASQAVALSNDPAPTFRLALYHTQF